MNNNYYAVIMAGGIGSRFWPISTSEFPKQFHDMLGTGQSLLQKTFSRLNKLVPAHQIQVLTNERYKDLVLQQLPLVGESQVVLEPEMRNTAPCILLSALKIRKENPDALMLVAPSDHWIEDEEAFIEDVTTCFDVCQHEDMLVTLGIQPTFPNTGYGYIEAGKTNSSTLLPVQQFCEKPDYETAKQFISDGNFFWNAGIFLWSVSSIIDSFERLLPEMFALFNNALPVFNTDEEPGFLADNYGKAENISIDYGIMEKAKNVFVKKANFDWNDLGAWGALYDKLEKDKLGNTVVRATGYFQDSTGNMIFTTEDKLVVLDGIKDYIVVDKEDVLMIFPKQKDQDIKQLVASINERFGNKFK